MAVFGSKENKNLEKSVLGRIIKGERYIDAWILGILTITLFTLITVLIIPITYVEDIADDNCIGSYLAGYWTGTPEWKLPFIHPLFSWIVSRLYIAFPGGYWYPWALFFSVYFSGVIISRCFYELAFRLSMPLWVSQYASLAWFAIACYDLVYLSFTTVPGELCSAAAALILVKENCRKYRTVKLVFILALILQALIIRYESAYAGLCFCFAAFFYRFVDSLLVKDIKIRRGSAGRMLVALGLAIAIFAGVIKSEKAFEEIPENKDYFEFHKACAALIDYPHSQEEKKLAMEENDISPAFYELLTKWCWMDERIDADLLYRAAGADQKAVSNNLLTSMPMSVKNLMNALSGMKNTPAAFYPILPIILFPCGILIVVIARKRFLLEYFCVIATTIGAAILLTFCGLLGRLPIRVVRMIAVPCFTVCFLLFILGLMKMKWRTRPSKYSLTSLLVCMTIICCVVAGTTTFSDKMYRDKRQAEITRETLDELVISNPHNIYFYTNLHCCQSKTFPHYDKGIPSNAIYWGGAYYLLEPYDHQLSVNGIEKLEIGLLLQDNVYFVNEERYIPYYSSMWAMTDYLSECFGNVQVKKVASLDGGSVTVYKYSLLSDEG